MVTSNTGPKYPRIPLLPDSMHIGGASSLSQLNNFRAAVHSGLEAAFIQSSDAEQRITAFFGYCLNSLCQNCERSITYDVF